MFFEWIDSHLRVKNFMEWFSGKDRVSPAPQYPVEADPLGARREERRRHRENFWSDMKKFAKGE